MIGERMAAPKKTAEKNVEPTFAEDDGTRPSLPPIEIPGETLTVEPPGVFAAMVKAQAEIGNIAKTALNPHFKSKFVDLATASEHILPILNKHGLFVIQGVDTRDNGPVLNTTIYHEDGSSIGGFSYPLVSKDANDPQKLGASMTYARRYSLMAIVGAAPEDDDGNSAATPAAKKASAKDKLKKQLLDMKADGAKFKELAKKAGVSAENFAGTSEADAQKILDSIDGGVPF